MSRIEEIAAAIERLSPEEFHRIAKWFREREQQRWDEELDSDSTSVRLERKGNPGKGCCGSGRPRNEIPTALPLANKHFVGLFE
jgi:hypothetical protein